MSVRYFTRAIAKELSSLAAYCDELIQFRPVEGDDGTLLEAIDCPARRATDDVGEIAGTSQLNGTKQPEDRSRTAGSGARRAAVLLNGNLNYDFDIQALLVSLKQSLTRGDRVLAVLYNPYMRLLYQLAGVLGLRTAPLPSVFVTKTDLENLCKLSGFEIVRVRPAVLCPFRLFGLGTILNVLFPLFPFLRWFGIVYVATLRPIIHSAGLPSLSIVIPARNERGNIRAALERLPSFGGAALEIIFVEGHSTDGTYEEIEKVASEYSDRYSIKIFKQTGKGKSDAVRLGFSKAERELLTILDADLTMPPELLPRFYEAYVSGLGDFINGNRLTYPMEANAMRFLNRLGNIFFAKAVGSVLDSRLGDTLCGSKLMTRRDYERMTAWRADFGDFDPFGDFELLFPAALFGLGIVDVAIRYRDRTYGSTNISRFRHGWMLLKMTTIGLIRIKTGRI